MVAQLVEDGHVDAKVPLRYTGESSTYSGKLPLSSSGRYQLRVLAMEPATANLGMDQSELSVVAR